MAMIRQKTLPGPPASVPSQFFLMFFQNVSAYVQAIGNAVNYDLLARAEQVEVFVEELFRKLMNTWPHLFESL